MVSRPPPPLTPYPRGWYLAAHSDQLAPLAIQNLRIFGEDVVLFRDAQGQAHLVDAYCPHLGAHLGHGGKVVDDRIRCPFHGWEFAGKDGMCQKIANGDPVPPKARLRCWILDERDGAIFVWFHERGEPPTWHVGEFPGLVGPGWSRWHHGEWILNARIQDITENDADISHTPVMHDFTSGKIHIEMDADGPRLESRISTLISLFAFGVPKALGVGPLRDLLGRVPNNITVVRWGISLGWISNDIQLPGGLHYNTQTLATTTPIDAQRCRLILRHRVRELPVITPLALRSYAGVFNSTLEQDIVVWEHKIYRPRPIASRSDWAILRFRSWARQFYDPHEYDAAMGRVKDAEAPTDAAQLAHGE